MLQALALPFVRVNRRKTRVPLRCSHDSGEYRLTSSWQFNREQLPAVLDVRRRRRTLVVVNELSTPDPDLRPPTAKPTRQRRPRARSHEPSFVTSSVVRTGSSRCQTACSRGPASRPTRPSDPLPPRVPKSSSLLRCSARFASLLIGDIFYCLCAPFSVVPFLVTLR